MKIKGQNMTAVIRYKTNFGKRSAYFVEYEDAQEQRHMTATLIENGTGEKSKQWYGGIGIAGYKVINKIANMNETDFDKAEGNPKYTFI